MDEVDVRQKALEAVKDSQIKADSFRVSSVIADVINGSVVFVEYTEAGKDRRKYVYVSSDKSMIYSTSEDLIKSLSGRRPHNFAKDILSTAGIAGLIAVIITVTICYIVIRNPDAAKIPEVLSGALTTILGFYFGSQVSKSGKLK